MSGAVDLAAVQARNEAAARAAEAPAPTSGQYVVDVTEANFQAEVLDRSFQVPVVIEVRSPRSPASAQLSEVLERAALSGGGQWILASLDVDANPRIGQALQVQVVPTVFAVIGGQLVPGFEGALPEEQLQGFVDAVVQAGREAGLSAMPPPGPDEVSAVEAAEPDEPEDPRFAAAEQALEEGDFAEAIQRYEAILAVEPANTQATLALLQVRLLARVSDLDPALVARAEGDPSDVAAQLAAADVDITRGEVESALRRLLDTLARTAGDERDTVRQRLIEYFDLLGPDEPHVAPARRDMARVLF